MDHRFCIRLWGKRGRSVLNHGVEVEVQTTHLLRSLTLNFIRYILVIWQLRSVMDTIRWESKTNNMGRNILQKVDIVHEVLMKHVRTTIRNSIAHDTNGTCAEGRFLRLVSDIKCLKCGWCNGVAVGD